MEVPIRVVSRLEAAVSVENTWSAESSSHVRSV